MRTDMAVELGREEEEQEEAQEEAQKAMITRSRQSRCWHVERAA